MTGNSKRNLVFILLWLISVGGHLLQGSVLLSPDLSDTYSSAIVGELYVSGSDAAQGSSDHAELPHEEERSPEKQTRLSVHQISAGSASPVLMPIAACIPFERVFLPEPDRQILASMPLVFVALLKFYRVLLISIISANAP